MNSTTYYLFDHIINLTLTAGAEEGYVQDGDDVRSVASDPERVIQLTCPTTGMKPDITMNISLIPNNTCYNVTVKVKNLNLDIDVRRWTHMKIQAGYQGVAGRTTSSLTFEVPIYRSYIASPNPDGYTVFEGVTTGSVGSIFRRNNIDINFNESTVLVKDLIEKCVLGIGITTIKNYLPDSINNTELPTEIKQYKADNGYALLSWLQETLMYFGKTMWNKHIHIVVLADAISIFTLEDVTDTSLQESIINLDAVSSASLAGGLLTVKAPWVPNLLPGGLFYMPPVFLEGMLFLNSINPQAYQNKQNLYRVLRMDVSFGTCGNINQMQVVALPSQNMTNTWDMQNNQLTLDEMTSFLRTADTHDVGNSTIDFGELKTQEAASFWNQTINNSLLSTHYIIQKNDTLEGIAASFYASITGYTKTPSELTATAQASIIRSNKLSNPSYNGQFMWPLIALATNQQAQANGGKNEYYMNIENPDAIIPGKWLCIPTITNVDNYRDQKSVFLGMRELYSGQTKGKYQYADAFWNIYVYLGGQ